MAVALFLLTSCSQEIEVLSVPSNAKIYINNEYKGTTPLEVSLPKPIFVFLKNDILIKAEKQGYVSNEKLLEAQFVYSWETLWRGRDKLWPDIISMVLKEDHS